MVISSVLSDSSEAGMAQTQSDSWRIHVVADSDSRWKWGATLARRIAAQHPAQVHATLLRGRSCPSDQQLADIGESADSFRRASLAEATQLLQDSDAHVVVLACVGGGVQAMLHGLARVWSERASRPVVVTGYVGLVYEKIADGLLLRAGADVVLANSAADAQRFREIYRAAGVDPDAIVQTALPFLGGAGHDASAAGRDRPFTVTFVTQPGVPESEDERRYALSQAIEHARLHRDRHVIVKLRARMGERTTHVEPIPYPSLVGHREMPENAEFVYGAMSPVLDRTDLCVTVSSTAALEAMHRGIPTAVLTDFGVRELMGNQLFLGCGALASWRQLHDGALPRVDPQWAAQNGVRDAHPYAAASAKVGSLIERRDRLPALRPAISPSDAGSYLPWLLNRYGLDPTGAPQAPAIGTHVPFRRRALRGMARRAYQLGIRVVEPRVRRMAQL